MSKIIVVDIEKCMGCKSCELECAIAHSSARELKSIIRKGEKPGYRISVEAYGRRAVPVNCRHCEEPACVMACPTGAVHREADGEPVIVDNERCIGCGMCVQACPFGVITLNSEGRGVLKCDLCVERLAEGQDPACVTACVTGALVFIEEEESTREKRMKTAKLMATAQLEHSADI